MRDRLRPREVRLRRTTCGVLNSIHEQSPDIAQGVDESWEVQHGADAADPYETVGAGDQGMMFGYACNETSTLMPMPIYLAHRLAERLTAVRKDGTLSFLRPDGKTQVSVRYVDGAPVSVEKVVVSTQHADDVDADTLREAIVDNVVKPVFEVEGVELAEDAEIYVNPTGRFVIGGPMGDAGLTGRKIIVDTYGGMGRHGGGAFSGKDCTKVDRSAAYAARWVAKNVVAAGLADRCEVQIAYAIGVARPVSVMVETFGTEHVAVETIERAVNEVFDLCSARSSTNLTFVVPSTARPPRTVTSDVSFPSSPGSTPTRWMRSRPLAASRKERLRTCRISR